jgi:hypothetical protein
MEQTTHSGRGEDQELHRRPLHQVPRGEEGVCQRESNQDWVCGHRQRGEMSAHHDLASPVRWAMTEMESCFHEDQRPAKRSVGRRHQICAHGTHASECLAALFRTLPLMCVFIKVTNTNFKELFT